MFITLCFVGSCDEFCQKVLAIDTQSQAQFEQDFLSFQSQFGNSLGSGEEVVPSSQPTPGQRPSQPPRGQTQVADIPSNSNSKPDENFKSNNNVQNKNFLFFGNNNKSPKNPPIQQQTVTKPPPTRCSNELGHPTFAMMTSFQIHNTFHSVHNNEEDNEASKAKTNSDRRGEENNN